MSAADNRALIERFYDALDRTDGAAMAACYAPDAHFRDPAFGDLHGDEVGGMWRMLTSRATDLSIELRSHEADEESGSANWVATYTFTATGRPVVNDIQASFRFRDGLIADHVDEFDFGRWARQALGPGGIAVALLPPLRKRATRTARRQLADFMSHEQDVDAGLSP
jgi:ketosteroid isomerase-like protein